MGIYLKTIIELNKCVPDEGVMWSVSVPRATPPPWDRPTERRADPADRLPPATHV